MANDSKVEVRPLPLKKWHGKEDKENFSQPIVAEVLFDRNTGKYATGLTEEEAIRYGKILGADLSDNFNYEGAHPYWSSKASWVPLPNHTIVLDAKKPNEFVKIKNLKASKKVANSLAEWENNQWPEATHYIVDEEEEVANKALLGQKKKDVYVWLDKMTVQDKAAIVMLMSKKDVRKRSSNFIDGEIEAILNPVDNIKETLDQFLAYVKMGRETINLRSQVLILLMQNILTKEGEQIYYMGESIGMDIDSAVRWFKDPNNQILKVAILDKLK